MNMLENSKSSLTGFFKKRVETFCEKYGRVGEAPKENGLDGFLQKYGGLNFDNVVFRPGAVFTNGFGLTERYKVIDGKVVWGYPGIHKGIDRGASEKKGQGKMNPIFVPFDAGSSGFKDWAGRAWGSDVYLFSAHNFRVRISHMYPDTIKVMDKLMSGYALRAKTYIGPMGGYGFSTGDHSHTEIESWGFNGEWLDSCSLLDLILEEKHGKINVDAPISLNEIVKVYRNCGETKSWEATKILKDYENVLKEKKIVFLNKYKMVVSNGRNKATTLYSSRSLFGM